MRLPLFPLDSVLFPGGRMPLRIFEARYLDMISHSLRSGEGFGICLIEQGGEVGRAARPHAIGTLAYVADWDQGSDGLLQIVVEGAQRYRLLSSEVQADQLLLGEVELLPLEVHQPLPEGYAGLARLLQQMLDQLGDAISYPAPRYDDAGWVGGRLAELLPVESARRQSWLELDQPPARLEAIAECLEEMAREG